MIVLQYSPSMGSIDPFNNKLRELCAEHEIIGVTAAVVFDSLLLTLTEIDDLPIPASPMLLQPIVVPFAAAQLPSLGQLLNAYGAELVKSGTEESPLDPVETRIVPRVDDAKAGYAVILACVGVAEIEGEPS